jgi:electron transport complex protein RnfG
MDDILKLGFKLLLISLVAAVALAFTNGITEGRIQEQRLLANEQARKAVFTQASSFEEADVSNVKEDIKILSEGFKALDANGSPIGYVFKVLPSGYGGSLEVVVGIKNDGTITGVRIGKHEETPGLGAKATEESFYGQYAGMDITDGIGVSTTSPGDNEIAAISGATITSKAVTTGVNQAIEAFEALSN